MEKVGLYVHVPFCRKKCPYCDFYSVKFDGALKNAYVDALVKNIRCYDRRDIVADTLYFGGGTPSLLTPDDVKTIVDTAKSVFSFSGEATMEANPESASYEKLCGYREAGINRISFGVQSMNENELEALGRLHTATRAADAVIDAQKAGFDNISVDVMLGTPFQTRRSVTDTLSRLVKLPVKHISAYMLKTEKGTPFYQNDVLQGCPDEDETADIYLDTISFLKQHGFLQYEISNFAKAGFESRHNLKYWELKPYIGFGASAHSYYNGKRFFFDRDIKDYINTYGEHILCEDNSIDIAEEYIMLSLRLAKGISKDVLKEFEQVDFDEFLYRIDKYVRLGLMVDYGDSVALSERGFLLSNYIISDLLLCVE